MWVHSEMSTVICRRHVKMLHHIRLILPCLLQPWIFHSDTPPKKNEILGQWSDIKYPGHVWHGLKAWHGKLEGIAKLIRRYTRMPKSVQNWKSVESASQQCICMKQKYVISIYIAASMDAGKVVIIHQKEKLVLYSIHSKTKNYTLLSSSNPWHTTYNKQWGSLFTHGTRRSRWSFGTLENSESTVVVTRFSEAGSATAADPDTGCVETDVADESAAEAEDEVTAGTPSHLPSFTSCAACAIFRSRGILGFSGKTGSNHPLKAHAMGEKTGYYVMWETDWCLIPGNCSS